jgi:hypothetical protein
VYITRGAQSGHCVQGTTLHGCHSSPCRLTDRPARLLELPLRAWIELP